MISNKIMETETSDTTGNFLTVEEKQRIAQWLMEETKHPSPLTCSHPPLSREDLDNPAFIAYIAQRLNKLKPSKLKGLLNSINAMFQYQGGISPSDQQQVLSKLVEQHYLALTSDNRVHYTVQSD